MFRYRYKQPSKYHNKTAEFGGQIYHSKREAAEAFDLDMQLRAGEITEIKRQVRISLDVNGYHICNYIIDFVIYWKNGTVEYREVKGFETDTWRMKWKLFEALYSGQPNILLSVVR